MNTPEEMMWLRKRALHMWEMGAQDPKPHPDEIMAYCNDSDAAFVREFGRQPFVGGLSIRVSHLYMLERPHAHKEQPT